MNPKIFVAISAAILAGASLLSSPPQPNPIEAARLNNLGCAYMNQQLFEKGLKAFQQAAELDPKLAIARLNEGIAYLNLQKIDEAKSAIADALKQDPKSSQAWYNLGLLYKNTGDAPAAIDAFKRVAEIDPSDADTWYFLGTAYVQSKQFPSAIEAFQHALQLNPLHASAEFGLSRAYQQSGDVGRARENLKKFQYITEKKLGAPMSLAYGEQGQYSRAVESPAYVIKPGPQIKVQFVDVTKEAGIVTQAIGPTTATERGVALGHAACFLDYDNDGRIDLFLPDDGAEGGESLYHNIGNGRFVDVTTKASLDPRAHVFACTSGDYDNDGFADLVFTSGKGLVLLHNEHNGTFKDVTVAAGLKQEDYGFGVTFVDYDHDGDLDLFVGGSTALWRNNGDGTFTSVTQEKVFSKEGAVMCSGNTLGSDVNNDRAVDLVTTCVADTPEILLNPREGVFQGLSWGSSIPKFTQGVAALDFDHDGWMDLAFTNMAVPGLTLWRNNHGKSFDQVKLPETNWVRAYGVAAFDYDNDGWVDLVAVGETKEGKGEIKLFRNLGPDGFKDVTADVGLDRIDLESPRAIITGDYDNDGAVDLLITQNHGPAVLLRNEGGNQNYWLRLALKGLNDNKSAIGTKVEVFSGGNRQKFEIYGSNGYLGQNSPYLTVGLGDAKEADVVRMLWPTGVLQDEIQLAADQPHDILELDRRGSSCPTLFVWDGERYRFVADMLGAGVVGHWVGPGQRDIPRPVEYVKIDRSTIREKAASPCHPERSEGSMHFSQNCADPSPQNAAAEDDRGLKRESRTRTSLSFRFMEPLEEAVYLDQVRLLAVDHPAGLDVYPNEYFASNPPYPEFKVVVSRNAKPPAGAWDEHTRNVLPDLLAHRFIGEFGLTQFLGFAQPHSLTLDLGDPYRGGPLWLLLHGEVEYFSANSMYAASQAGITAIAPYLEAWTADGKWVRTVDDMGFPAGGPRTMTADLTGKLPVGTQKIRITTNLQIYWDSILISRTPQPEDPEKGQPARPDSRERLSPHESLPGDYRITSIPLVRANLQHHGYPLKIEGTPPGNVNYIYERASATGPYTRPAGTYTRYGDVLPLLQATDDKLAVFGSGDEVQLDFDPAGLPALPQGWARDYFFAANGYEKDMDFYAAEGNYVAPLPFLSMGDYPYGPPKAFPLDDAHVNYLLEYNTRNMSGNEQPGYAFDYGAEGVKTQSASPH